MLINAIRKRSKRIKIPHTLLKYKKPFCKRKPPFHEKCIYFHNFFSFLLQTRLSLFELCWTTETWLCDSDCGEFWIHCCVCWQYYRHFRGRSCLVDGKVYQKTLRVSSTNRPFSVFIFFLQIASMGKGGRSHKSVTFLLRFYPWTNFTCSEIDFSQWNVLGFFCQ